MGWLQGTVFHHPVPTAWDITRRVTLLRYGFQPSHGDSRHGSSTKAWGRQGMGVQPGYGSMEVQPQVQPRHGGSTKAWGFNQGMAWGFNQGMGVQPRHGMGVQPRHGMGVQPRHGGSTKAWHGGSTRVWVSTKAWGFNQGMGVQPRHGGSTKAWGFNQGMGVQPRHGARYTSSTKVGSTKVSRTKTLASKLATHCRDNCFHGHFLRPLHASSPSPPLPKF